MASTASPVIPYGIDDLDGIGMLHSFEDGTDAIVMVGEGSPLEGMTPRDQKSEIENAARVTCDIAIGQNDRLGFCYVDRRRPVNRPLVRDEVLARIHPDFFLPEGMDLSDLIRDREDRLIVDSARYNDEILDLIGARGKSFTQAAVMTIKREHIVDEAFDNVRKLDRLEQRRTLVTELRDAALAGFGTLVTNAKVLDYVGLHDYIHGAWNVESDQYNKKRQQGATTLVDSRLHVPQREIVQEKGHCWVDGTCHAVLEVTQQPKEILVAEALVRFELPVPYYSYALVSEAISYKSEFGSTSRWRFLRNQMRNRMEMIDNVRSDDADAKLDRRTRELYHSKFSNDYIHLIAISATNLEELKYYLGEAEKHIKRNKMSCMQIMDPAYQLEALWRATTGV